MDEHGWAGTGEVGKSGKGLKGGKGGRQKRNFGCWRGDFGVKLSWWVNPDESGYPAR